MGHTVQGMHNLLERGSLLEKTPLNSVQQDMDRALSSFASQAADPFLISSFMIGHSAKRLFDFMANPFLRFGATEAWSSRIGLGVYKTLRLGSEATAFEIGHRSLQVGFQGADASLLAWNGNQGLRNGLLNTSLNFFTLHGMGKIASGENIVFQHFLQSAGIVAAHQMAAAVDLAPASEQSLSAQLFEAEIFNIQQQGTAQLSPTNYKGHLNDLQVRLNLTRSPASVSKISLQSKRLPLMLALPEMRSEGGAPTSPSEQITALSLEAWTSYERGIRAAKEGVELFVGALNLRLATGPQRPFLLEASIEGALHQHFGIVCESAEAIRAMEAPFERLLFAIRGQGEALPEGFATMKGNIRSQRETLEGQVSSWQDIFEPTLKTAALNESNHLKVQDALARYFNPELGFGTLELLPFREETATSATLAEVIPFHRLSSPHRTFASLASLSPSQERPHAISCPEKIVLLGDIHTKWQHVQKILDHEFPEGAGIALAVGDLQNYPPLRNGHRIYFIPGNHDNSRVITELHATQDHPTYSPLLAGEVLRLGALRVTGIPGVFSPHYFAHPEEAPLTYLTPERIALAKSIPTPIDILLMHDAPAGVGFQKDGSPRGDPLLRGVMEALQPSLVLFGHHHQSFEGRSGTSRIVGLDYPKRSYVVLDPEGNTFSLRRFEADLRKVRGSSTEFQYPWERDIIITARSLFEGERIMVDKKERFREQLDKKHRQSIIDQLAQVLLAEIPPTESNRDQFAKRRALLAANTALDYAAEYATFLEAHPQASLPEKQATLSGLYDRMSQGVLPSATPDLIRAFEAYLKVLGIVKA